MHKPWLAAWVAILAAGCSTTRPFESPTGPHFSVLTYNVNFGGPAPDLAVETIAEADADIVCLQETTAAWENLLRARLAEQYPQMRFFPLGGAGGMALLSRLPIVEVQRVDPTAGWFPAWVLLVQTPVGAVQVANIHLRPSLADKGQVSASAYIQTKDIRRREVEALWPHLAPGVPTVILGDFNEGDDGSAIRYLAAQGMVDSLPEFDRHSKTWRWQTSLATFENRFDHILYSRQLHCLRAQVINRGASDHLPVFAVFQNRVVEFPGDSQGRGRIYPDLEEQAPYVVVSPRR